MCGLGRKTPEFKAKSGEKETLLKASPPINGSTTGFGFQAQIFTKKGVDMKNKLWMIVIIAVIAFLTASCSKDNNGGGSSGGSVKSVGKETPATDFQYDLTKDGKGIAIRKYMGKGGKVVIPAKIEDYPVLVIGPAAFTGQSDREYYSANKITDVVIPEGVVELGDGSFHRIDNLKSVTIPSSIVKISGLSFSLCGNMETLTIPDSLTKIEFGMMVFTGCGKLPLKTRERLKELGYTGTF
jgi:hypothetical protein